MTQLASRPPAPFVTVEEYLRLEAASSEKHEYHAGKIVAMAGGSGSHSRVATNLTVAIGSRLRGKPCTPYNSDLRIRIPRKARYFYPDLSVFCEKPARDPEDTAGESFTNPTLVVEVLSPSTEKNDRILKFDSYREIDSFKGYVLVAQDQARIETFKRNEDGSWRFDVAVGLEASITLRSLDIVVPLTEIYAGVEFPPPPPELSDVPPKQQPQQ